MAYIHHSQFDPSKLVLGDFVTKESRDCRYLGSSIMYEYESKNGHKVIAPLSVKGPDLYSPNGIQIKSIARTTKASLYTSFDLTNPEVSSFVSPGGFYHKLYSALTDHVWNAKNPLHLNIKKKSDMESIFPFPITFRHDDNGDIIPNRNPSKYFDLDMSKEQHTIFSRPIEDVKYRKLGWDMLQNVSMTFKPTITFSRLVVVGGKVTLTSNIKSAIISNYIKNAARSSFDDLFNDFKSLSMEESEWMAPPPYCLSVTDVIVEFSEPPPYSLADYNKAIQDQELPPPSYE